MKDYKAGRGFAYPYEMDWVIFVCACALVVLIGLMLLERVRKGKSN